MNTKELFWLFSISVLQGTTVTRLTDLVPAGGDMESLFFSRKTKDAVYLGVRLALKDSEGVGISVAQATDGSSFFLVEDGTRDARFISPTALFLSLSSSPTEWAQAAQTAVKLLADFKNKNLQNPLLNKLDAVIASIQAGNYADALGKLKHDILGKTDGCATARAPDKNDWVKDCKSQEQLYPIIIQTIDLLRSLIN
jgi:hypothetical protein